MGEYVLETFEDRSYSFEVLTSGKVPEHIDKTKLEVYFNEFLLLIINYQLIFVFCIFKKKKKNRFIYLMKNSNQYLK